MVIKSQSTAIGDHKTGIFVHEQTDGALPCLTTFEGPTDKRLKGWPAKGKQRFRAYVLGKCRDGPCGPMIQRVSRGVSEFGVGGDICPKVGLMRA